jgi:hypothetical protein
MKPYNEKEFNRLCAEFLGINLDLNSNQINKYYQQAISMYEFERIDGTNKDFIDYFLFHSDWNWIMEVVEKIEMTKKDNEWYVEYIWLPSTNISFSVRGWSEGSVLFETFGRFYDATTKKEAVVQAIWRFLNWYNEQKL